MTKNNMDLWNAVSITRTTNVKKAGRLSAIDAHSQIQAATEQFGPAGKGWGWSVSDPIFPPDTNMLILKITLWHGTKDKTIEQFGGVSLIDHKKLPDTDAFKKAATDGLTKCLSYLGFNADVFLGKFDDNKYLQQSNEHFVITDFNEAVSKAPNVAAVQEAKAKYGGQLSKIGINEGQPAHAAVKAFESKLSALKQGETKNV
jgi:hypothetical protein